MDKHFANPLPPVTQLTVEERQGMLFDDETDAHIPVPKFKPLRMPPMTERNKQKIRQVLLWYQSVYPQPSTLPPTQLGAPPATCQHIAGDPTGDDSCKCGAPVKPGSSYCREHDQQNKIFPDDPEYVRECKRLTILARSNVGRDATHYIDSEWNRVTAAEVRASKATMFGGRVTRAKTAG